MSERPLGWFKSYFADRQQSVHVNGELSNTHQIPFGVPQGSILGPLLFNICINSLPAAVEESHMNLYVDDVVLIYSATPLELNRILQRDVSLIPDWYTYNKLTLNVCRKQNNAVKI